MKRNYHLTNTGVLKRKDNTLVFNPDTDKEKSYIPIQNVDAIYAHKEIRFNSKLFKLLDENTVELHLFSWGGRYLGGYMPTKSSISGEVIVEQVESYKKQHKRKYIAISIAESSVHNMYKTLKYYDDSYSINNNLNNLESIQNKLDTSNQSEIDDVSEIMGYEGDARTEYYKAISKIIPDYFDFETRNYNPPKSNFNALISYGNSLLYGTVSSAIQSTALNPTISYLHEPSSRRHSLSLDIADIFKPVIIDRLILRLVNRNQIKPDDFTNDWILEEKARKTVLSEYEKDLENTIEHPKLNRHVSYQYLIKLDVLNLKKHIITGETYDPFKRWW